MQPINVQYPGSNDVYTITRFSYLATPDYYPLAEYLASRFQRYFTPQPNPAGGYQSVDQELAWRAECSRVTNGGGVILQAHHTSHSGRIIGVAMARTTGHPNEAEMVVNGASWDSEQMEAMMLAALRQECARQGLVLGNPLMVRQWIPA